jgi:hypothetical protein
VGDTNKLLNKKVVEEALRHGPFKTESVSHNITIIVLQKKIFRNNDNKKIMGGLDVSLIGPCFALLVVILNGNLSLNINFPVPTYDRSCILILYFLFLLWHPMGQKESSRIVL